MNISRLRAAFDHIRRKRPFEMDGIVVLPDHIHCIWRLPEDDDFPTRWRLIKHFFSRSCKGFEGASSTQSRQSKDEKAIWQRRYWEHLIRDEDEWRRHMDYIHYNPVKHGVVDAPAKWHYSSFHRCVERKWYSHDWGSTEPEIIKGMNLE